jgi:hypothetical protein
MAVPPSVLIEKDFGQSPNIAQTTSTEDKIKQC